MWSKLSVTFIEPDSSYKATGIKIMVLNEALYTNISDKDCPHEFPVIFRTRGTGFVIPSYLSPQDLHG